MSVGIGMTGRRALEALARFGLAALLLSGCLGERVADGGSGSEYTNGTMVVGWISQEDGSAAKNARVWIRPSNHLQDTALVGAGLPAPDGFTDKEGYFHLDSVPFGTYTLEVKDDRNHGLATSDFSAYGLLTDLAQGTLRSVGTLAGKVEDASGSAAYVQVIGLNRVTKTDGLGLFAFPDLPPGLHQIRIISARSGVGFKQPGVVAISPGQITHLQTLIPDSAGSENYADWPYSRTLRVNMAAAGLSETVYDFPLLVRIYNDDSVFSRSDGKDLRFAGPDGRHLSFEIERWEPPGRLAEIWVKVDSLPPGPDPFDITLFWGKRDAPILSDSKQVFSSFTGVWHLAEAQGVGDSGIFRNASPSGISVQGRLKTGNRRAIWGYGGLFDGSNILSTMGEGTHALQTPTVVLSAWIRPTDVDAHGSEVASMGDNYALRIEPGGTPVFFAFDSSTWDSTTAPAVQNWKNCRAVGVNTMDKLWHHLAGVADGTNLRLYVDGVEKASLPFAKTLAYPLGQDFLIGTKDDVVRHNFIGQIDEVQVSGQARSAAWIKLAYLNQKSGSSLIEFR